MCQNCISEMTDRVEEQEDITRQMAVQLPKNSWNCTRKYFHFKWP